MQRYREAILYVVFIIIGFVFTFTKLKPEVVNLYNVVQETNTKKIELAALEQRVNTLKASQLAKSVTDSDKTFKKIYQPEVSTPDVESAFTVVFDDIVEMAKYNGVKVYAIEYIYNPPEDEFVKGAGARYNVCQLNMQLISDYTDFEGFMKELYKYPYLINFSKVEMFPYEKNRQHLLINLQLKLYSSK